MNKKLSVIHNLYKRNEYVNFTSFDVISKKYNRYKTIFKLATDRITIYKN